MATKSSCNTPMSPPIDVVQVMSDIHILPEHVIVFPCSDCITMHAKAGDFRYTSPGTTAVCGLYIVGDPDTQVEVLFHQLDVTCDSGGLIGVGACARSAGVFRPSDHRLCCWEDVAAGLFTYIHKRWGGAFVSVCVACLASVTEVMSHWGWPLVIG